MSILLNGDCLELLNQVQDKEVDLIFCDLPYGQTNCKWDCVIDLDELWKQFMRIKKLHTPIIMTCTTKFGVSLIQSAPKKCPFRYDLIWCKSSACGFLSAKKMPMRKHEMIYVFYEKLPFYDLSSHKHKFIESVNNTIDEKYKNKGGLYSKVSRNGLLKNEPHYEPPLPNSLIKEDIYDYTKRINNGKLKETGNAQFEGANGKPLYEPPLPNSLLEIKSTRGKHSTEKPVDLMKWILKYYSKEGDVILDATMGSGSMGVACKEMNRNFFGIEKDIEIYEVAINRIET